MVQSGGSKKLNNICLFYQLIALRVNIYGMSTIPTKPGGSPLSVFVVIFSCFCEIIFFGIAVVMCHLVHDVKTIPHLRELLKGSRNIFKNYLQASHISQKRSTDANSG